MLTDELFDRTLLEAELSASSDPDNPGVEEMHEIVRRTITIAVVGISRNPAKAARRVPSYLATRGADIIPVNPHADRIFGRKVLRSLDDVAEPVDMVMVFRPSAEAGDVIRQAMRRPEKPVIWLQEGIINNAAADYAKANGLNFIMDTCMRVTYKRLVQS